MWIEFSFENPKRSIVDLPTNQRLPLVQGIPLLEETSRELVASDRQAEVDYLIYTEKNQDLPTLEATLTLPVKGQTIVEAIQAPVRDNDEVDSEDAEEFLSLFEKSVPKNKRPPKPKIKKKEKVIHPKEKRTINKKPFLYVGISILALMAGVVLFMMLNKQPVQTNADNQSSYEQLISNHAYSDAASAYPKKVDDIEQLLYENVLDKKDEKSRDQFKNFIDKNKTKFGRFDESILDSDYTTAVEEYEKNNDKFNNDTNRLTLVGYAYLKINAIDQAKQVAKIQTLIELEKKIFEYEQLTQAISEKEEELQKLASGGSKNRKKAEEVATEKFALQEELLNL